MNIIFLDIDGVLNSHMDMVIGKHDDQQEIKPKDHGFIGVFQRPCLILHELIAATDAKIVLSSTWRMMFSTQEMEAVLRQTGCVNAEVIDKTPIMHDSIRGVEIQSWLDKNTDYFPIKNYVIIDDDNDMLDEHIQNNFVLTDHYSGLTPKDGIKAARILLGSVKDVSVVHRKMVDSSLDVLLDSFKRDQ